MTGRRVPVHDGDRMPACPACSTAHAATSRVCPACLQAIPGAGASPYDLVSFPPLDAEAFAHLATDIARGAPLAEPVAVLEEALRCFAALPAGRAARWDGHDLARRDDPRGGDLVLPFSGREAELRAMLAAHEAGRSDAATDASIAFAAMELLRGEASTRRAGSWAQRWHAWQASLLGRDASGPVAEDAPEVVPGDFPLPASLAAAVTRLDRRHPRRIRGDAATDEAFARLQALHPPREPGQPAIPARWRAVATASRARARLVEEARAQAAGAARASDAADKALRARTAAAIERAHDVLEAAQRRIAELEAQVAALQAREAAATREAGAGAGEALLSAAAGGALGYLVGRKL